MPEQRTEPKSLTLEQEMWLEENSDCSLSDWREKKELEDEDRHEDDE